MSIYNDIATSFTGITSWKNETQISDNLSKNINNTTSKAVRELPFFAQYHGYNAKYSSPQQLVTTVGTNTLTLDSSIPARIDISVIGKKNQCNDVFMAVEAKKESSNFYNLAFCCQSSNNQIPTTSLSCAIQKPEPILIDSNGKKYLFDHQDGIIWADICRLLQIQKHASRASPPIELYQLFYINHSYQNSFSNNLKEIYKEYTNVFLFPNNYGSYVITSGRGGVFHAWEAYKAKFECINLNQGQNSITISDATQFITPFCCAKNCDLYLIKITYI